MTNDSRKVQHSNETAASPAEQVRFHFRVPQSLLDSVKDKAKARGIPYTRYIRMLMEQDVAAK